LVRRWALKRFFRRRKKPNFVIRRVTVAIALTIVAVLFWLIGCQANQRHPFNYWNWGSRKQGLSEPRLATELIEESLRIQAITKPTELPIQPLVMTGGDPYIRALMRTISASEANHPSPYSLLYGGKQIYDLSHHPQKCVTIATGPNKGRCSTAAGRYQILYKTWLEKAEKYHPRPSSFLLWTGYSFEPEYQDAIIYSWLNDGQAWGVNISDELRQGKIDRILRMLSGTWTSLGYGKEDNSMTPYLPQIYQRMLREELQIASQN